jgi:CubicO group peptidase (beta-lactamase class C family)
MIGLAGLWLAGREVWGVAQDWQGWWADVQAGLAAGAAPGGAVWAAVDGQVVLHQAAGSATLEPAPEPLRTSMRFDLASVTKAIATTSCILALMDDGKLDIDAPAAEILPALGEHGKGAITPRQLITHSAGLPAWVHFYKTCASRDEVRDAVLATSLASAPGTETVYSDVGFLTLGFLIEAVTAQREDAYLRERVLTPLDLAGGLGYLPPEPAECVATERDTWRGKLIRGEVHDENAFACGGVAGHAGLFGQVDAVGRFGQSMLDGGWLSEATRAELFRVREDVAGERFWLGWKRLRYDTTDKAAFGHDGFTGTLLWISPACGLVIALLTNRVHPTRANRVIYEHRPRWMHEAAMLAGGEAA